MSETTGRRWLPPAPALIQAAVIALGIGLWMTAGKEWILLAGLGAFVPGMLRELGLMRDLDEFQREMSRRAAFHAYLVGGLAIAGILFGLHLTDATVEYPADLVTLILVILWITWLFSYLLAFWGPEKTATVVLLAFGAFWALFGILSGIGESEGGLGATLMGIAMHLVFVVPFGVGAWAAGRWPRPTGWFLLAVGIFFVYFVGRPSAMPWTTTLLTVTTLGVPILASGIGLVRVDASEPRDS